jgi:hypothetical protein
MTKASTAFNKFITSFIEKHCPNPEDILEIWENEAKDDFIKTVDKELKKTPKAKKEKKPADAPKAARSGYILFCMEERPKINKEFFELSNQDKVKLMAERWNKAKEDEDIMEHFKKLAEEDKKRATKDKENYVPSTDPSEDENQKKKGKRSKTGYMLFCNKERENVKSEGFTGKDITTELARRWKALKEEDEDMYSEYMEKASDLKKKASEESDDDEEEKPKKKVAPKKKSEESDDEEEKPKKKAAPKKKTAPKKKAVPKKKVVEESDSESSDEE